MARWRHVAAPAAALALFVGCPAGSATASSASSLAAEAPPEAPHTKRLLGDGCAQWTAATCLLDAAAQVCDAATNGSALVDFAAPASAWTCCCPPRAASEAVCGAGDLEARCLGAVVREVGALSIEPGGAPPSSAQLLHAFQMARAMLAHGEGEQCGEMADWDPEVVACRTAAPASASPWQPQREDLLCEVRTWRASEGLRQRGAEPEGGCPRVIPANAPPEAGPQPRQRGPLDAGARAAVEAALAARRMVVLQNQSRLVVFLLCAVGLCFAVQASVACGVRLKCVRRLRIKRRTGAQGRVTSTVEEDEGLHGT